MSKLKRLMTVLIALLVAITLFGCGNDGNLSAEEKKRQAAIEKEYLALGESVMREYLRVKYGEDLQLHDIEVPTYFDTTSGKSTGIYKPFVIGKIKRDKKTYDICLDINGGMVCYDNIQHDQIISDIKTWLSDLTKSDPYYLVIDAGVDLDGFDDSCGMTKVYHDGDIVKFIENGGVDSIIAFYDVSEIENIPDERIEVLEKTHRVILAETNERRFGNKEVEDIVLRGMHDFYIPYITEAWENENGDSKFIKPLLNSFADALYYGENKAESEIATSKSSAPAECLRVLEEHSEMNLVSVWYYVQAEKSTLFFKKDRIPNYDGDKQYYALVGVKDAENEYKAEFRLLKDIGGNYLTVECEGYENWYAVCEKTK